MKKSLVYYLGRWDEQRMLQKEFELSLRRKVAERIGRGWVKTYKPVMDDAPYRIFDRMRDYKYWCERELPRWLGYGKAK